MALLLCKQVKGFARACALVSLLIFGIPAGADEAATSVLPAYSLPSTEVWDITSAEEAPYRVFVSMPEGPAPTGGYPVLYVLDGNAIFASFAEARRVQEASAPEVAQSIIVAVGYPTDKTYDLARRLYDFTSPYPPVMPPSQEALKDYKAGGHEKFLDFLLNTLRPEVATRYSVNPHRQALFGHSLGGLFALHVLYTHPSAFNAIIAASPSTWWNDQELLTEERAFTKSLMQMKITPPMSRIMVVAGDLEAHVANVWDSESLAKRLEPLSAYGLRSRFEMLEGETHLTVPSRAVTAALRFAFALP
ncbi:alpha/beta hydrolase [Kordiimonas pumila]|uniref:Alpha/beta hydrolase n=1 Tax=Kordiimonas pumila TaxID=2161677 RepID=A0ABV7D8E4_9PROT|nr:alpha/beta hydrolase-fold protein [Kordiimonas pumila]